MILKKIKTNKRGASEWTVSKLVALILLVAVIVLVVVGLSTGALNPLVKKVKDIFNSVLALFGKKDGGGGGGETEISCTILGKERTCEINYDDMWCKVDLRNRDKSEVDYITINNEKKQLHLLEYSISDDGKGGNILQRWIGTKWDSIEGYVINSDRDRAVRIYRAFRKVFTGVSSGVMNTSHMADFEGKRMFYIDINGCNLSFALVEMKDVLIMHPTDSKKEVRGNVWYTKIVENEGDGCNYGYYGWALVTLYPEVAGAAGVVTGYLVTSDETNPKWYVAADGNAYTWSRDYEMDKAYTQLKKELIDSCRF